MDNPIRAITTLFGLAESNRQNQGDAYERRRRAFERFDSIELTGPRRVMLRLLRERVLDQTRRALELGRDQSGIAFAEHPRQTVAQWVGRLLSDQNLMASKRRGDWSDQRIADSLMKAMTDGVSETLEILQDNDELDETAWSVMSGVIEALQQKLELGREAASS